MIYQVGQTVEVEINIDIRGERYKILVPGIVSSTFPTRIPNYPSYYVELTEDVPYPEKPGPKQLSFFPTKKRTIHQSGDEVVIIDFGDDDKNRMVDRIVRVLETEGYVRRRCKIQWVEDNFEMLRKEHLIQHPEFVHLYNVQRGKGYQDVFPAELFPTPEEAIDTITSYKDRTGIEF